MYESRESSSPIVTRSVAAALAGKPFSAYEFSVIERTALRILGAFPQSAAGWLIPRMQRGSALSSQQLEQFSLGELLRLRLADYDEHEGQTDSILVGAAMGGTSAHLALATRSLFLPEAFVLTLQGGAPDGNVQRYFDLGADESLQITRDNPGLFAIQHFDPVHDGWLTRSVHHLRVKLIDLPEEYREFIRNRLKPGGELIYLEGGATWLRYRIGERNVFQVGGWGGISSQEFLEGSARLRKYCLETGFTKTDWHLQGFPLASGAESEWGSEAGLGDALAAFAAENGFQFRRIALPNPNSFSLLALAAFQRLYQEQKIEPAGIFVGTFSQFDPVWTLESNHLPVWLIFNTGDSLEFLRKVLSRLPSQLPVYFSALATFSLTPDMVPWQEWLRGMQGRQVVSVGARASHYPCDARALVNWQSDYHVAASAAVPVKARLSGETLLELAGNLIL